MTRIPTVRHGVEPLVRELLGNVDLAVDEDGDVSVRWDRALLFLRVLDREPPRLRIECPMLHGVVPTPRILDEIHRLNTQIPDGRMYWEDGQVVVATEVVAETTHRDELEGACRAVAGIADHFDVRLREAVVGT
ncbi:MAG: T3SS (YopN, CesT) and YbjN peptide-binding chaperone 1 [Actinomycetota bacterium]